MLVVSRLQVNPLGEIADVRVTVPVNPLTGAITMVEFPASVVRTVVL